MRTSRSPRCRTRRRLGQERTGRAALCRAGAARGASAARTAAARRVCPCSPRRVRSPRRRRQRPPPRSAPRACAAPGRSVPVAKLTSVAHRGHIGGALEGTRRPREEQSLTLSKHLKGNREQSRATEGQLGRATRASRGLRSISRAANHLEGCEASRGLRSISRAVKRTSAYHTS